MNPYANYRKVTTQTADPIELVIRLYRGAITYLNGAERAMSARDVAESHRLQVRAQDIVAELMGTINLDAGEVANNLSRLYDYMQQRLIAANMTKDPHSAAEVRGMLVDLLGTWEEIARSQRGGLMARRDMGAAVAVA
jgi:flagellar protein FliS